jgi:cellulose synthase/poly-beta-1,6-N-acetylglucosamine synthase-like glycosyltransferase
MTAIEITLLSIFCLAFLIQMVYYWYFFSGLAFHKERTIGLTDTPPVSVVIAARNEYHHLINNLPAVLNQDYPDFEVVVVNHASDDESAQYLTEVSKKNPRLKIVNIERELNFFTGKKFPLSLGIKSASHELLLLTDADCKPAGTQWLKAMVDRYDENTEVLLGYGPYFKKPGFTNLLVRYDTFLVAMQYLSFAIRGLPYMGVGRNLSYKRSMFFRNKGFTSHYKIASGDDDLFINQVAGKQNTNVCIDQESFVYSEPVSTMGAWFTQKRRHLSTGSLYKPKFKFLLGAYGLSQVVFFTFFVLLVVLNIHPLIAVILLVTRLLSQFIVHKKILSQLGDSQLLLFSLSWELFHALILYFITLIGLFRKPVQWK